MTIHTTLLAGAVSVALGATPLAGAADSWRPSASRCGCLQVSADARGQAGAAQRPQRAAHLPTVQDCQGPPALFKLRQRQAK